MHSFFSTSMTIYEYVTGLYIAYVYKYMDIYTYIHVHIYMCTHV